jgi:hypothetical protein
MYAHVSALQYNGKSTLFCMRSSFEVKNERCWDGDTASLGLSSCEELEHKQRWKPRWQNLKHERKRNINYQLQSSLALTMSPATKSVPQIISGRYIAFADLTDYLQTKFPTGNYLLEVSLRHHESLFHQALIDLR